jgi:hypothetical protein
MWLSAGCCFLGRTASKYAQQQLLVHVSLTTGRGMVWQCSVALSPGVWAKHWRPSGVLCVQGACSALRRVVDKDPVLMPAGSSLAWKWSKGSQLAAGGAPQHLHAQQQPCAAAVFAGHPECTADQRQDYLCVVCSQGLWSGEASAAA